MHLRRGVERILMRDGKASGVRLEARAGGDARDVRARVVLSNADLRLTLERLVGVEHLPASWVARVVMKTKCAAEEIIDHCARNLAPYKVPRRIEFCESIN